MIGIPSASQKGEQVKSVKGEGHGISSRDPLKIMREDTTPKKGKQHEVS